MKRIPMLRFLVPLVLGIIISWENLLAFKHTLLAIFMAALGFVLIYFVQLHYKKTWLFVKRYASGIAAFVFFFLLGFYLTEIEKPENNLKFVQNAGKHHLLCVVDDAPKETAKTQRYFLKILGRKDSLNWQPAEGSFQFYLAKSNENRTLNYGDTLVGTFDLEPIVSSGNPFEFDFASFMALQGIYYQSYAAHSEEFSILPKRKSVSFFDYVYAVQEKFLEIIQTYIPNKDAAGIVSALVLGKKDFISDEVLQAYSKAGGMHVLAVSGMHMGVIYLLISRLFAFLKRSKKRKKLLLFLVLIGIWSFAFVAGLGPSVRRASVMFSIIAIGDAFEEKPYVFNSLALAAFILLCFNPLLIFHIGFQLSFSAVWAIVYFQPKLAALWREIPNVAVKYFWDLTTVSLAATLGTFIITIFYFHQMPLYFLFTNLFIIPTIAISLNASLLLIITSFLSGFFAEILGAILSGILQGLNFMVGLTELLPMAVLDNIYFSEMSLFAYILFFALLILAFELRKIRFMFAALGILVFWQLWVFRSQYQVANSYELAMYEVRNKKAVEFRKGFSAMLFTDIDAENEHRKLQNSIFPHSISQTGNIPQVRHFSELKYFESDFLKSKYGLLSFGGKLLCFSSGNLSAWADESNLDLLIIDSYLNQDKATELFTKEYRKMLVMPAYSTSKNLALVEEFNAQKVEANVASGFYSNSWKY